MSGPQNPSDPSISAGPSPPPPPPDASPPQPNVAESVYGNYADDDQSLPQHPPPPPTKTTAFSGSSSSSEALAKVISGLIGSVIRDFDAKAEDVSRSQDQVSSAIDRLTAELDQLLEDAPLPFIMQHAAKISGVRKRVSSLNSLLKSIQRRLDRMDQMLSLGSRHGHEAN